MGTEGSGASRAGGEGFHNEDAFLVEEGLGLYVVCDGASGTPAGEVAARVATRAIEEFVDAADGSLDLSRGIAARKLVEHAMRHALSAVIEAEGADPKLAGLSTTVTMLLAQGGVGVFGHFGDSRGYLVRRDRVHQLTIDDEFTETPADEDRPDAAYDVFVVDFEPGDTVVLCTDGAEKVVQDEAIARVAGDLSPQVLASRIVAAAHRGGSEQDATAVVVRVRGDREPAWLELSSPLEGTAFGHTLQPLANRTGRAAR